MQLPYEKLGNAAFLAFIILIEGYVFADCLHKHYAEYYSAESLYKVHRNIYKRCAEAVHYSLKEVVASNHKKLGCYCGYAKTYNLATLSADKSEKKITYQCNDSLNCKGYGSVYKISRKKICKTRAYACG